jgi:hypothetical protein
MTPKPMQRFFFGALQDEGLRVVLKGRFFHSQLIACEFGGIIWKRHVGESAEEINDLRQMLASETQRTIDENHAVFAA